MLAKFYIFALVVCLLSVGALSIRCQDPRSFVGRWVIGVDKKECVALVKEKCNGLKKFTTRSWKKGRHVKSNCGKIAKWTAIATFLGRGGAYRGHAAIFESCAPNGIWVYDQWNTAKVQRRLIRYGGKRPNYNGNNYYEIVL